MRRRNKGIDVLIELLKFLIDQKKIKNFFNDIIIKSKTFPNFKINSKLFAKSSALFNKTLNLNYDPIIIKMMLK